MQGWEDKVIEKHRRPMRGFEKVAKYADVDIAKPARKTDTSAGYDMVAAHDVIVHPIGAITTTILMEVQHQKLNEETVKRLNELSDSNRKQEAAKLYEECMTLSLDEIKSIMKITSAKPTLISTGYKAYMQDDEKLDLSVRSSLPLNAFIILANPPGLIDSDYYNNPDNEGEIFFQVINLSPVPIQIKRGDIIGQGVFNKYLITDDDHLQPKQPRKGGFGSTSK